MATKASFKKKKKKKKKWRYYNEIKHNMDPKKNGDRMWILPI